MGRGGAEQREPTFHLKWQLLFTVTVNTVHQKLKASRIHNCKLYSNYNIF